jgi:A/G-specific adenine glycosylase
MWQKNLFLEELYRWSSEHPRPMPWRSERNPYRVWVSEIMLQQTRVEQAIGFFARFMERFPSVQHLADAPEVDVLKCWEGLGYNSRARNLHAAAKYIATDLNGSFPNSYEGLLALKGIGPYTAAAIGSFAFGLSTPVVDTNVVRIFARLTGTTALVDEPGTIEILRKALDQVFDGTEPARFNQAIMDFGAMQCTPKNPDCQSCPFGQDCLASKNNLTTQIPAKSAKKPRKAVHFDYLVIKTDAGLCIRERTETDIWKGLWEFPSDVALGIADKFVSQTIEYAGQVFMYADRSTTYRQMLTHRAVTAVFHVLVPISDLHLESDWFLVNVEKLKKKYPVPGIIRDFITTFRT